MIDLTHWADEVRKAHLLEERMKEPLEVRLARFNLCGTFGYMTAAGPRGGNYHPDRCKCQGDPNPNTTVEDIRRGQCGPYGDTTPHKHYTEPPYACARCVKCTGYRPHDWPDATAILDEHPLG